MLLGSWPLKRQLPRSKFLRRISLLMLRGRLPSMLRMVRDVRLWRFPIFE